MIYIVDSSDTERIDESKDAFGRCVYVVCQSRNCVFILSNTRTTFFFSFTEKMISNAQLQGVPLLVLANKQDLQVRQLYIFSGEL